MIVHKVQSKKYFQYIEKGAVAVNKKKDGEGMGISNAEEQLLIYKKEAAIPDKLNILEVSEILGASKEEVLQMAEQGTIKGERRMNGRGIWRFDTVDFVLLPNFVHYFEKCKKVKKDSLALTKAILEDIEKNEDKEQNNN